MAIFSVQVVISMIVSSFLHKISPYFSVGRELIIYRLRRYQTPSDTLLCPHVIGEVAAEELEVAGTLVGVEHASTLVSSY